MRVSGSREIATCDIAFPCISLDRKAKKVFKNPANEEDSHAKALQKLAAQMLKGEPVTIPKLTEPESFDDATGPIFTKEFKETSKDRHVEVSAPRSGMKPESESAILNRKFSEKVEDPKVKEFLLYLSSWKSKHYDQLKKQVGFLEDFNLTKNSDFRF